MSAARKRTNKRRAKPARQQPKSKRRQDDNPHTMSADEVDDDTATSVNDDANDDDGDNVASVDVLVAAANADAAGNDDDDVGVMVGAARRFAKPISAYPASMIRAEINISRQLLTDQRIKCVIQCCVLFDRTDTVFAIVNFNVHRSANTVDDNQSYAVAKDEMLSRLKEWNSRIASISYYQPSCFQDGQRKAPSPWWQGVKPDADYILGTMIAHSDKLTVDLCVSLLSGMSANMSTHMLANRMLTSSADDEDNDWSHAGSAASVAFILRRYKHWNKLKNSGKKNAEVAAEMNITRTTHLSDKAFVERIRVEDQTDVEIGRLTKDAYLERIKE
jgi:hypothetical protein